MSDLKGLKGFDSGLWTDFRMPPEDGLPISLKVGEHSLEVRAQDEGFDVDTSAAQLTFNVHPIPLQERRWFFPVVASVSVLTLLLAGITFVSRRRIAYYAEHLQKLVDERTLDLKTANIHLNSEIAEHQQAEKALRASEQNMQELIYIASHDLQTPIVSMVGFAGIILKRYTKEMSAEGIHAVKRIKWNAEKMRKIILSLLDLSRLNTVKNLHRKIKTKILLEELFNEMGLQISEKDVAIKLRKLPDIKGDQTRITSVFRNLLSNALNYGGKNITIGFTKNAFYVKDDGIGISEHNIQKIFKAGERLKKVDVDGVGMGLTFCRKVIEQHEGKIWAESDGIGKGSTFYFTVNDS